MSLLLLFTDQKFLGESPSPADKTFQFPFINPYICSLKLKKLFKNKFGKICLKILVKNWKERLNR